MTLIAVFTSFLYYHPSRGTLQKPVEVSKVSTFPPPGNGPEPFPIPNGLNGIGSAR